MPEHPELRAFTNFFNMIVQDTIFISIKQQVDAPNRCILKYPPGFTVQCVHRGKQLKFVLKKAKARDGNIYEEIDSPVLQYSQDNKEYQITVGLGLCGYFKVSSLPLSDAVLSFVSKKFCVNICTDNNESLYYYQGDFDYDRSPDPIYEHEQFMQKLQQIYKIKPTPLCIILLDQSYFNGVGNYLRCELIHRMNLDPFAEQYDVEEIGDFLCYLIEEAYEIVDQPVAFYNWLQCYMKAPNAIRVNGRTLWTWRPIRGERVTQVEPDGIKHRLEKIQSFMLALGAEQ